MAIANAQHSKWPSTLPNCPRCDVPFTKENVNTETSPPLCHDCAVIMQKADGKVIARFRL